MKNVLVMSKNLDILYTSLQGRYARALFLEGEKINCLDAISEDFTKLDNLFFKNHHLKKLLSSCSWGKNVSNELWQTVGKDLSFCPLFLNFIQVVSNNARLKIIDKIRYIYDIAYKQHKHVQDVVIYSVTELSAVQRKKLEKLLAGFCTDKVAVHYEIDEKLLAGIKISSGGTVIDASVATQIMQLENFCRETKLEREYENKIS